MKRPWKIDRRNEVKHLARQYKNKIAAFRELTSNALDAYEEAWNTQSESELPSVKMIDFTINHITADFSGSALGEITCTDYATGITNMEMFEALLESGKKGDTNTIGQFGMGRVALIALTREQEGHIRYISNNGDIEQSIDLDLDGIDPAPAVSAAKGELGHKGVQVVVSDVTYMPSESTVINYLSNVFSLRMSRDALILIRVNGKQVPISKEFDKQEGGLFRVGKELCNDEKHGIMIEGNIQPSASGIGDLSIYQKYIRIGVSSKSLGLNYRIKGWINCDQFELTDTRDDIKDNEDSIYPKIVELLSKYLDEHGFKKIESEDEKDAVEKKTNVIMKDIGIMLKSLLANEDFRDRLNIPSETIETQEEIVIEVPSVLSKIKDREFRKRIVQDAMNDAITGSHGAEFGPEGEGFKVDGETKKILPGSGQGIHTDNTIPFGGDTPTINKPTTSPNTRRYTEIDAPSRGGLVKQKVTRMVKTHSSVPQLEPYKVYFGNSKPPMYVVGHKIMINVSNTVYRIAYRSTVGYVQLFSLAMAHLLKDYNDMDIQEREMAVYGLMLACMKGVGLV